MDISLSCLFSIGLTFYHCAHFMVLGSSYSSFFMEISARTHLRKIDARPLRGDLCSTPRERFTCFFFTDFCAEKRCKLVKRLVYILAHGMSDK